MQFLLNADGSIPAGQRAPEGARLTLPTAVPAAEPGMVPLDLGDGEQDGETWLQKWTQVPIPPEPVPVAVTPLQARRALRAAGLLDAVGVVIAGAAVEEQETWEYAILIPRNDATLNQIADALGMTQAQIDELFIAAATL